jgi:cell pole-organizing protein PopZ
MTKPQFSTEPSMEDILASIRKMISEERLGPRPIPDQMGRSPFGDSVTEIPTAVSASRDNRPTPAPTERPGPSFSSLSDALKAATPSPDQRLSLEEKIADMLETGEAPSRTAASDALAVFAATRLSPVPSPDPTPFGVIPRNVVPERAPGELSRAPRPSPRPPEAPINGAARRRDETVSRQNGAPATPKVGPSTTADSKNEDTQRIIAMPPRNGAGAAPAGPGKNGTNVSSLGVRPFPGNAPGQRPSPDAGSVNSGNRVSANNATPKSPDSIARAKGSDGVAENLAKSDRSPRTVREEAAKARAGVPRPGDSASTSATARDAAKPGAQRSDDNSAKAAAQPGPAKPMGSGPPSDALLDAVVALVHKEPDTLSVFTSGASFIHGVNDEAPTAKPGPNMAHKLDRSASELLRPMLRQWLSDNMPRIVEEALRSELLSSQSPPKDSEKK